MGNTILITEDEQLVLNNLTRFFSLKGFTVYPTATCAEAVKLADQHRPDCFLLDYHLPDGSAADICRYIRGNAYLAKAPIVILSGDSEQAIHTYDDCEADCFVEKGKHHLAEIEALLKRQLRRSGSTGVHLTKSDLILDPVALSILKCGKAAVSLSFEQFRLFTLLFEKSPDFVTEDEICSHVFTDPPKEPQKVIAALAYRLRQKLGTQLSRRIKYKRNLGWIYVQPRLYSTQPACESPHN